MRFVELSDKNKPYYVQIEHIVAVEPLQAHGYVSQETYHAVLTLAGVPNGKLVDETPVQVLKVIHQSLEDEEGTAIYQSELAAARN